MKHDPAFLDLDGCPTEAVLKVIAEWKGEPKPLLELVYNLWRYPDYWSENPYVWPKDWDKPLEEGTEYHVSTAGWSGNESLIDALQENNFFWMMHWYSTTRGGHYVFHVNEKKSDREDAREFINAAAPTKAAEPGK